MAGLFDDLVPSKPQQNADTPPAGPDLFGDLVPKQPADTRSWWERTVSDGPSWQESVATLGKGLLAQTENIFHGASQGTDPNVRDRLSLGNVTLQDDAGGYYFKGADGKDEPVDFTKHNLLRDQNGNLAVYAHDPNHDESGLKGVAHIVSEGLLTSPLTGPAQSAAMKLPAAAKAAEAATEAERDLQSFQRAGVSPPPAAFSSGPTRSLVKGLGDTIVGKPIEKGFERTYSELRSAADKTAEGISDARTPREAGQVIQEGIERFKDARPEDIIEESVKSAAPERLQEIIAHPASTSSLKTKQAALYEQAWRSIPELEDASGVAQSMRKGRAIKDNPRVMQQPSEARAVLQDIMGRNAKMTVQSGKNAVGDANLSPVRGGLLGDMMDAVRNPHWSANLQTLRDMRSSLRRLHSGMPDTERNVLSKADVQRLHSALSRDMTNLLAHNAGAYAKIGDTARAQSFTRAIRQFQRADTFTRLSMDRLDNIEKLFKADNHEQLAQRVTNAALAGGKGNFEMLRTLSRTLHPEELNDVRASIFRELFKPVPSARGIVQKNEFSAQSFLTRWRAMSDDAKALLFGGDHAQSVDDIVRMADRTANVEAMANVSKSGITALNAGGLLAGIGKAVTGDFFTPLAWLGGGLGASYLLSRPMYAQWARQLLALKAASLSQPGRLNAEITSHLSRLGQWARRDPELTPILNSMARENGVTHGDGPDEKQEQPGRPEKTKPDQRSEENRSLPAPHGSMASMLGLISPAAAAAENEQPNLDDVRVPGAPTPNEGRQMQADADAQRARGALLSVGDTTIIPSMGEMGGAALDAFNHAGEAAMAFGPAGGMIDDAAQGFGSLINNLRAGGRGAAAAITGSERAIRPSTVEEQVARLKPEVEAMRARAEDLGIRAGELPDAPRTPEQELNLLNFIRDSLGPRIAQRESRNAAAAPSTAVPVVDTAPMRAERDEIVDFLRNNPYVQAVPGRQGFPKKTDQIDTAKKFFDEGNRLDPAGPWGRDPVEAVRNLMRAAGQRGQAGPMANRPSVEDLAAGYQALQAETKELRAALEQATGADMQMIRDRLREANQMLVELQQQILKLKGGEP